MRESDVLFPCGQLSLQGSCYYPDDGGTFPAVVLCHPHPMYGGSMDNNVILALSEALVNKSIIAFMFNFRGVGRSEGDYGGGVAEREDVAAALSWLVSQPEVDTGKVGLAGYSFGAAVASPVACDDERVKAMALISPPPEPLQMSPFRNCLKPKLIVVGDEDYFVSPEEVESIYWESVEPKQFELVPKADHFWYRHEATASERVAAFFSSLFRPA